ncbi:MAG TPA: hypothetical protein PKI59_01185, partial [Candidatus Cloacimonadota bacterium]|nr:hypothetical protein [Candidatus Cloacimonadota bacterium]
MKLLPLLAILLLVLPFGAQEVPLELILDELPDEYTDAVFSAWDDFKLNLSGSYILSDNPYYIAHLKADAASFRLYANLKTEADDSWNNFQISYRKGRKNSITLGNYRVKASEGLVFSQASGADLLLPPPHPRSYSPFGALINVVTGDFDVYVLASDQKRNA